MQSDCEVFFKILNLNKNMCSFQNKASNLTRHYTHCFTSSNTTLTTNILSRERILEIIMACCKRIVYFLAVAFGKLHIHKRHGNAEYSTIPWRSLITWRSLPTRRAIFRICLMPSLNVTDFGSRCLTFRECRYISRLAVNSRHENTRKQPLMRAQSRGKPRAQPALWLFVQTNRSINYSRCRWLHRVGRQTASGYLRKKPAFQELRSCRR